jgi:hypothetical protein
MIVFILFHWRDAINFAMLVQATHGNPGNAQLNRNQSAWQDAYTLREQTLASRIMHILKLKCAEMVTSAWFYTIDNVEDDVTSFPVSKEMAAGAIADFKSARRHLDMTQTWWTPVEQWPVSADLRFGKKKAVADTTEAISEEIGFVNM